MILTKLYKSSADLDARLTSVLEQLYANDAHKAKLSNPEEAIAVITISENDEDVVGFVYLYTNPAAPDYLILGNYQCTKNDAYAHTLLEEVNQYALNNGFKNLMGPMCGSTWYSYRFNDPPNPLFFLESVHKDYYPDQWKKEGFELIAKYQTNVETLSQLEVFPDQQDLIGNGKLSIRPFSMEHAQRDLVYLHRFCSDQFVNNVLYSPISEAAFLKLYQPLLPLLDPEYMMMVFDKKEMVGLLFAVPDLYNPEQIVVKTIARNLSSKYKGLAHAMSVLFVRKAIKDGYKKMVHAYIHVDNNSSSLSSNFGGRPLKFHYLLSRPVS